MADVKRRGFPFYGPNSTDTVYLNGSQFSRRVYPQAEYWSALSGTQVTESENHAGWQNRFRYQDANSVAGRSIRSVQSDVGGNFTMTKSWVESPSYFSPQRVTSGRYLNGAFQTQEDVYTGGLFMGGGWQPFPPSARSSDAQMDAWGTKLISLCAPTNNVANLATAVLELYHDGLPKLMGSALWKSRTRDAREIARSSGDEFLNEQFGWVPLLSDITDFASGVSKSGKLVKQYIRDSGRVVRRRRGLPPISTTTNTNLFTNVNVGTIGTSRSSWSDPIVHNQGTVARRRETQISRWFSGAFTYHIPESFGDRVGTHASSAAKLLGIELTPDVVWELAPWSWAVDWFTDTGDLVHNLSSYATDGLVLQYGYVMEHSLVRDTIYWVGPTGFKLPENRFVFPPSYSLVTETKLRRRATPFGFGLTMAGLTTRQKAITAALGLSRL